MADVCWMDDVRQWLNSKRDYQQGVTLVVKYCPDPKLKRLFLAEDATDFKRKRLHEILDGVYRGKEKAPEVKPSPVAAAAAARDQHINGRWPEKMDEVVQALYHQWKPLFSEMNSLQARIYDVAKAGNHFESGRMAHKILDLDDQCESIYQQREYYQKNGHLPADTKPDDKKLVVDPILMVVALKNAQRYLREHKSKLKKDPENIKAAALIKKWEAIELHYKTELKLI